ncbi:MAG: beta-lactamase family protein, partial [Kiritimatiellae bacterium]|nr:beta-lactamase family protein [Kiritimatiellia bacterium]
MNKIKLIAMSLASFVAVHAVADEVEDVLARYIGTGCIAGVVSVTSDADYNVKTHCAGWADVEAKRPMRDDTLFAIFSMTKTFTGIALLTAVDDGKISLEDEVSKFLPEFADVKMSDGSKVKRALTVRDLMNHTTGWRGGEKVI